MLTALESVSRVSRDLSVLGVPVDPIDMAGALRLVDERVRSGATGSYLIAVNPEKVCALGRGSLSGDFLAGADLLLPDGVGIVLAVRLLRGCRLGRVTGADLMQAICAAAPARGYRIFLYGGTEEVSRAAAARLVERYSGIRIVGRSHGFVPQGRMADLVRRINAARPDILFVALGSPRQEGWMAEYLPQLNVAVCQGIGGTLDTLAGRTRRAPQWLRRLGLEWLYRLMTQPSRAPRYLDLVRFAGAVMAAKLGR